MERYYLSGSSRYYWELCDSKRYPEEQGKVYRTPDGDWKGKMNDFPYYETDVYSTRAEAMQAPIELLETVSVE
jgi:hypothetical protein